MRTSPPAPLSAEALIQKADLVDPATDEVGVATVAPESDPAGDSLVPTALTVSPRRGFLQLGSATFYYDTLGVAE